MGTKQSSENTQNVESGCRESASYRHRLNLKPIRPTTMKTLPAGCLLSLVLLAPLVRASDEFSDTVSFDAVKLPPESIRFDERNPSIEPSITSFAIQHQAFLSNDLGERFALVTLGNKNPGLRSLHTKDIVGILANGTRLYPIAIDGDTQIDEPETLLLHFGPQKFPLVALRTRN